MSHLPPLFRTVINRQPRYDMDSRFKELLENPVGMGLLQKYATELLENDMFMMFAKERPLTELAGMLPQEAMQLISMVLGQCNANPV